MVFNSGYSPTSPTSATVLGLDADGYLYAQGTTYRAGIYYLYSYSIDEIYFEAWDPPGPSQYTFVPLVCSIEEIAGISQLQCTGYGGRNVLYLYADGSTGNMWIGQSVPSDGLAAIFQVVPV